MRTIPQFDMRTYETVQVPDAAISNVAFCDQARATWAAARAALSLPAVAPVLDWAPIGEVQHIGDSVRLANEYHRLSDLAHVRIGPSDDVAVVIEAFRNELSARRPVPIAFGRPALPQGMYWACLLTSPSDDFALRAVHTWVFDAKAWMTHCTVLYAPAPASETALSFVSPACPKCGQACWWEASTYQRETPTTPVPVACGCGWKGVSQVVR